MSKLISLILLLAVFSCANQEKSIKAEKHPNILLIVVDDQGYADFEAFDNSDPRVVNPNINKLAQSGIVYTQAYTTAPVCSPSRVGMLTGKNQFRWDIPASWGPGLPESVKTIAEYLKEVGYATARIGKNDLGRNFHKYDTREYPLKHGYDEFLGFNAHAHDYWLLSKDIKDRTPDPSGTSAVLGPLMHNYGEKSYSDGYLTDILTDEAIQYIKTERDKPFFLTLAYSSVHHLIHEVPQKYLEKYNAEPIENYNPDSMLAYGSHEPGSYSAYYDKYSRIGAINETDIRNYYLANLDCLDENIGKLLEAISNEGIDEETIIIYVSDNGGSPLTGANNSPLTAGKYSLWEGGIRVPMLISWPGKIKPGQTQTDYVSTLDILPTIAEISGVKIEDHTIDGINLFQPDSNRLLVWKWQKTWAVRKGDWKLTNTNENHWKSRPSNFYIKPIVNDTTLKLFNVKNDPGERINLANTNPEKLDELLNDYDVWCTKNIGNY
ncbi:sulfatase family protein [Draconibacterium sediminis]|uniref:Sulfatase N-terminal domain-containing protein n=1 Tax=Draconibacterium sediminis TaxID=1544798 RepID=A0A0D8JGX3_9BACT|nr:sulfatase-like hydrolase/transferase [Draconibacterium sediminis]KJF45103.1 hypothetical protein LH29_06750 [Draconibacterium sediminis]